MLKFCLTIDCERFISFKQGNPRWGKIDILKGKINSLLKTFRYNKEGFELLYKEIIKQRFPTTFMLTGRLFKPLEKSNFIEWGYHTYNHKPLTLLKDEAIEIEVNNIYNLESITPPLWMVEDINNPDRVFKILKKNGYKNIVYKGKDDGIKCLHYLDIKKSENKHGIKCVHLSNCFEGNWSKKRIDKIKEDIVKNIGKDATYVLSTHDFTHKNTRNLREIIIFIRKLEQNKKIKVVKIKDA